MYGDKDATNRYVSSGTGVTRLTHAGPRPNGSAIVAGADTRMVLSESPAKRAPALRTVLVVDDTPSLLDVVRDCLQDEGYRVVTSLSARDAHRLAIEERPDAIMLDVVMPEMSGWEVLAQLRADPRTATLPVVVCTAWVEEALGRLAELQGEKGDRQLGLLPKPFDVEELLDVIGSITAASAGTRSAPAEAAE